MSGSRYRPDVSMQNTELKIERDRELYLTYLRGLEDERFDDLTQAAEWVQSQPASKFYITSKALANYIGAIQNGKTPPRMYYYNELKIRVLYERYLDFIESHPNHGMSREKICDMLVEEPAPQFYISQDYIRIIIQRERTKKRDHLIKKFSR